MNLLISILREVASPPPLIQKVENDADEYPCSARFSPKPEGLEQDTHLSRR